MEGKNQKLIELENKEWLDSLEDVFHGQGQDRVRNILEQLQIQAQKYGIQVRNVGTTPYINTIPADQQPPYPGRRVYDTIERSLTGRGGLIVQ